MVSLSIASSRNASELSLEQQSFSSAQASPIASETGGSSAASSKSSLAVDEENVTVTAGRILVKGKAKERSSEDLRLLAVSTHMTELSYSISDIQTRIFEIQELRHQSQALNDVRSTSTGVIDQALMNLDERLESVNAGMAAINESIAPLLPTSEQTPKQSSMEEADESNMLLRKHAALVADWEAVQDESDVLREELKEDKWLTVFRTVSEQADGMMSSLEKAVKRCQDFIWQVHRRGSPEDLSHSSESMPSYPGKAPVSYETFCTLIDSFEAKKKHYMPATSKVLSIIDKGVQDRVTKNGECLRRHAESTERWRSLRERIVRTDSEMETVRRMLLNPEGDHSEASSTTSKTSKSSAKRSKNGFLATPPSSEPSRSRAPSQSSTLSRSISPFRKFAKKFSGGNKTPGRATPTQAGRSPATEPTQRLRHRTSFFSFGAAHAVTTPDRPTHKHSQSFTPESPSSRRTEDTTNTTIKAKPPRWNSSTKVHDDDGSTTIKQSSPRRPAAGGMYGSSGSIPPVPPIPRRSASRSSMASSRPWSPVTSSVASTTYSTFSTHGTSRPPSRTQSPSFGTSPRTRPKTPSQIPAPVYWRGFSSGGSDASIDDLSENSTSLMQRALSPTFSLSATSAVSSSQRARTPHNTIIPAPRPPSRSMIPIPSFQFSSASRPSSAMSNYDRPGSSMSFRSSAARAQTPESALRTRASQVPFFPDPPQGTPSRSNAAPRTSRPSLHKLPPSSFRDASATPSLPRTPSAGTGTASGSNSRPSSRTGTHTTPSSRPSSRTGAPMSGLDMHPMHRYSPVNTKDPLDVEVAALVNATAHGLLVERVDPPLRTPPREGEELKAQYAFSNQLARKVVTCRLTTMTRSGGRGHSSTTTKKVMCRVGGGWQDLQLYMLNRQAGM